MNSGFNNFPAAALPTKWRGGGPTLGTYSPAAGALFVMPSDSGTLFEVNLIPAGAVLSGKAFLPSYTQVAPGFSVWFKVANAPQATASTYVDFTINFYGAEQPKNVGYVNLDSSGNPFPIKLCRDGEVVGLMATPTGWDVIGYFGAPYQDNIARNPKGVIAQRAIATAVTNTSTYGACDGWKLGVSGTVTAGTYVQDTADGVSQSTAIKVSGLSVSTATPTVYFRQYIEAKDAYKLKNRVCSAGVWVLHTAAVNCNVTLKIALASSADNFGTTTGIAPTVTNTHASAAISVPFNTWTFIAIPSISWAGGGGVDASVGIMIAVEFAVSAGTLTTKDFKITDVTLQPGPFVAPPVDIGPQAELARCQRYFAKTFPQGTAPAQNAGITGAICCPSTGGFAPLMYCWSFSIIMRTTPQVVTYNYNAANANWFDAHAAATLTATLQGTSDRSVMIYSTAAGSAAGDDCYIHASADADF